jgi:flagellar biosynthesis protein FlhA
LAALAGAGAWWIMQKQTLQQVTATVEPMPEPPPPPEQKELTWDDVQPVDIIGLEVGYRLIPLVDKNQGGQLMNRIKGVRKKLSKELGFLIQPVHIRDNLDLSPGGYRISLNGVAIGDAEIYPDRELAINPGRVFGTLQGIETTDPAFGLEAVWIESSQRDQAQTFGYTVVDASTVVATHLSEILQSHAHELIGHEEVQQLMDVLSRSAPKLVEDLVPEVLTLGQLLKVLQNLLAEGVAIRDIRTIAETLAEFGTQSQDLGALTAKTRVALSRSIVQQLVGPVEEIPVVVLDPGLEQILQQTIQPGQDGGVGFEPGLAEQLQKALAETANQQETAGQESILLVAAPIRTWMARFVKHSIPGMSVLSYNEIPDNRKIKVVATVGRPSGET